MKPSFWHLPLLLLAVWASPAPAQTAAAATTAPGAARVSKGEAQALKIFRMLDADGDGRISRQEAQVGIRLKPSLAEDFRRADLNGDRAGDPQRRRTPPRRATGAPAQGAGAGRTPRHRAAQRQRRTPLSLSSAAGMTVIPCG